MKRFFLSQDAKQDLDDIRTYHRSLPREPALRIAQQIQTILRSIAQDPDLGASDSRLTRLVGQEVRSRLAASYRIYYRKDGAHPEIIAILHGARDHHAIMLERLT